jgi:CheY-like chemotaxis protein
MSWPLAAVVLIIEDNSALRESLEALMRADGYRTIAVADGDEAIEYAMRTRVRGRIS